MIMEGQQEVVLVNVDEIIDPLNLKLDALHMQNIIITVILVCILLKRKVGTNVFRPNN